MVDRDEVVEARIRSLEVYCSFFDGGWVRDVGSVSVTFTGREVASLNTVQTRSSTTPAELAAALDVAAGTGLPYCVKLARPQVEAGFLRLLRSSGLSAVEPTVRMAIESRPEVPQVHDLLVRRLDPAEADVHVRVAAEGFASPYEFFEQLVPPRLAHAPEVEIWIGVVDGEPVTTANTFYDGTAAGIFSVATPARHQRRGYGAAITSAATAAAFDAGAAFAWLEASPAGLIPYGRVGFTVVESSATWTSS